MQDIEEFELPTTRQYLDDQEVKKYLKFINDKQQNAVCRLLLNGVSIKEILKLRARDVKYKSCRLHLKNPKRKIVVDKVVINILVDHMLTEKINVKSKEKIIKYTERNIRVFVKKYGELARLDIDVSPKILQNTFFIIKLTLEPEWTVEDYASHLGLTSLDNLKKNLEYYQRVHNALSSKRQLFTSQEQ